MTIRTAKADDLSQIASVKKACANIDSLEEAKHSMQREMDRGYRFVVAEENGQIVGIVSWLMHGRPKHGLAEIEHMDILPEFRRRGLGTKLMVFLIEEIKKLYESEGFSARKLYFPVRGSNEVAIKFYETLGFSHETTLKNHFYDGQDEWIMSLFLE